MSIDSKKLLIIIPIISSLASFSLSAGMKFILNPEEYGAFAVNIFKLNLMISIGLIGFSQVVIRMSSVGPNGVVIDKKIFNVGVVLFFIAPLVLYAYLKIIGVAVELNPIYVTTSWSVITIAIFSLLHNLQGNLFKSYLITGAWKIAALVIIMTSSMIDVEEKNTEIYLFASLFASLLMIIKFGKVDGGLSPECKNSYKSILLMYFVSMISVISYSSFESLDRLMMLNGLSEEIFGNYYFTYNFLMAPTAILVSFYSMQRLHAYKKKFSYEKMTNDVMRISLLSIGMTVFLLGALVLSIENKLISNHGITMDVLIFISILCVIKHGYSMLSMSYSIVASKKTMINIGLVFGIVSVFVTYAVRELDIEVTVSELISLAIILWLARVLIYFYAIKKDSLKVLGDNE